MAILFLLFFIAISSGQVFFKDDSFNDDSIDVNIKDILEIEPPKEVSTRFQL